MAVSNPAPLPPKKKKNNKGQSDRIKPHAGKKLRSTITSGWRLVLREVILQSALGVWKCFCFFPAFGLRNMHPQVGAIFLSSASKPDHQRWHAKGSSICATLLYGWRKNLLPQAQS
jgi:hypothetical protein